MIETESNIYIEKSVENVQICMTLKISNAHSGEQIDHFDDPIKVSNAHGIFFVFEMHRPESLELIKAKYDLIDKVIGDIAKCCICIEPYVHIDDSQFRQN